LLPAAVAPAAESISCAVAACTGLLDDPTASGPAKAASFLHVSAHVDPNAPNRNCLLLIIDSITLTVFPFLLLKLICLLNFGQDLYPAILADINIHPFPLNSLGSFLSLRAGLSNLICLKLVGGPAAVS
jgi:hypothetical protein